MSAPATILVLGCGLKQDAADYDFRDGAGQPVPHRMITLDADASVHPDLVCYLGRDPIALPDDSVDLAVALHLLEHIGQQGQTAGWFDFWEDLYRVMKPNGLLQFECPLSSSLWAWADPTHSRAINEYTFLYFNQDAYRSPGSSIPRFRIKADWVPVEFVRRPDHMNPDVVAVEPVSHLQGKLRARKPFRGWWEDA